MAEENFVARAAPMVSGKRYYLDAGIARRVALRRDRVAGFGGGGLPAHRYDGGLRQKLAEISVGHFVPVVGIARESAAFLLGLAAQPAVAVITEVVFGCGFGVDRRAEDGPHSPFHAAFVRSEERRVGKEC